MAEPLIRIDHVEKIYRRDQIEVPVLLGVNLDIPVTPGMPSLSTPGGTRPYSPCSIP